MYHNGALMSFFHGRMGRMLTVALSAAWLATVTCADAKQIAAVHRHMPCCPPQTRTQGCSTAQCDQAPEKTEAWSSEQVARAPFAEAVHSGGTATRRMEALRELTPGLRFRAAVFRLKDDLRI